MTSVSSETTTSRAAIVVYRDAGSPSGEVEILLDRFSSDEGEIETAIQGLTPESGAPYFHELPDLGIYTAIRKLPWTDDDRVTKWILMFGDAPPYAESYRDKENGKSVSPIRDAGVGRSSPPEEHSHQLCALQGATTTSANLTSRRSTRPVRS